MISIDTNILVRAYLYDDEEQAKQAQDILLQVNQGKELFISSYAILEFAWVLKTKGYSRQEIYQAVIKLADCKGISIGQKHVVLSALEKYIKGKADFGDYMIIAESKLNGFNKFKTFDKAVLNEI